MSSIEHERMLVFISTRNTILMHHHYGKNETHFLYATPKTLFYEIFPLLLD